MSPSRSPTRSRISLASGAGGRLSPLGFLGTVAIHAAVVFAALFTWQHRLDIADQAPPVVPVDLVTIAPKTNIMAAAPKLAPDIPSPIAAPQDLDIKPPAIDTSEPAPPPVPTARPMTKPVPQPRPQDTAKKDAFNIDKLWAQFARTAPSPPKSQTGRSVGNPHPGIGQQNAMTMDLVDALRNQIEQCWNPPAGAPHPEQLIVYVELELNPDGSVARPPQLTAQSQSAAAANPFMRAAADAAMRAIYVCAPFKLPANRFADWRDSTIKFDPRDLVGP